MYIKQPRYYYCYGDHYILSNLDIITVMEIMYIKQPRYYYCYGDHVY